MAVYCGTDADLVTGLAMQIHYVSRILICANEPCLGGLESFMMRQKTIQDSIEMVCGIGMTLTEDASSMLSSQCLFIGKSPPPRIFKGKSKILMLAARYSRDVHAESPPEELRPGNARLLQGQVRLADAFAGLGA